MADRITSDFLRERYFPSDERRPANGPLPGSTPDESAASAAEKAHEANQASGGVAGEQIGGRGPAGNPKAPEKSGPDASKQTQGDGVNIEKLRADIVVKEIEDIKFDDIKGQDKPVTALKNICNKLRFQDVYKFVGAMMPRGVLLYGPPGTGKTMMATALANSAQAAFLTVNCADVMDKFVGVPEKRAEAIFDIAEEEAKKHPNGHAILFLDEVEALLRDRDGDSHEASEKVLSIFLQRINGLSKGGKVTIIAATNRADMLDAAFVSRMNAVIEVPLPDAAGRAAILKIRLEKCESRARKDFPGVEIEFAGDDIDYAGVAGLMVDAEGQNVISGRDLDNLANDIVSKRGDLIVGKLVAEGAGGASSADGKAAGKVQVDMEKLKALAAELGSITTKEVLQNAIECTKTAFMFDPKRPVEDYLKQIADTKAVPEAAAPEAEEDDKPKYGLLPTTKEEARHKLIDTLIRRIRAGDEYILKDLYAENEAMPDQIRGVVRSLLAKEVSVEEAITMATKLRDDESLEPPVMPIPSPSAAG